MAHVTPEAINPEARHRRQARLLASKSEIAFIRLVAPWFTIEEIHCVIAAHHEALMELDIDRLMVFMPPRTGKSQMGSIFLPSMWAGHHPSDQILQIGHSVELSRKFSMDVRQIMRSDAYQWVFPGVSLAKDAQALGRWRVEDSMSAMEELERSGEYNAAGVTSSIAGKGFHLGVCDDAMSEQDKDSKITKDRLKNWWGPGFYTRRMPERNAILINATRWGTDDLPGHLLDLQKKNEEMAQERHHGADVWTILNVPAILNAEVARKVYTMAAAYGQLPDIRELKAGDSFAPRRWTEKELRRSQFNMTDRDWQALYMGNPQVDEGHILKRKYWRLWPKEKPPQCLFVFQMYDTAFTEKEANDKSARTTWGVFEHTEKQGERPTMHMILLEAWDKHVDAPELKKEVLIGHWGGKEAKKALLEMNPLDVEMVADIDEDKPGMHPDRILIENKASGIYLIRELRRIRKPKPIPVWPWAPPRSTTGATGPRELSKFARAHMGSLVMEQGAVWYMNRKWALDVINKCAACQFLGNDSDADLADTVTASMIYVRQTYRVELGSDVDEEAEKRANTRKKPRQYYGARPR